MQETWQRPQFKSSQAANPASTAAYGISPSIVAAVNTDNGVVLTVSNANALTAGEGTIQYFEVYNGSEWQAATAQISGNVISLSADCASIQKVRYLYRDVFDSSNAFIYNEYGLPLAPIASIDVEQYSIVHTKK